MIAGLDSATPPTAAQVAAARAAGNRIWSGYLATMSGVNLLRPWTQAEFEVARGCGSTPIAFASGRDDPTRCRELAASWRVRLCLDVEDGIRGDGSWVQPWLDASGAGLYGNYGVHLEAGPIGLIGRTAAFHILADYPGLDPGDVWLPATGWYRPPGPLGWQWQGTHQEFGLDVDRGWYDDWFGDDPQEVTMRLFHDPVSGAIYFVSGSLVFHVESAADAQALVAGGIPQTDVSAQFLADLGAAATAAPVKLSGGFTVSGGGTIS